MTAPVPKLTHYNVYDATFPIGLFCVFSLMLIKYYFNQEKKTEIGNSILALHSKKSLKKCS